jgi:hypothetical protein
MRIESTLRSPVIPNEDTSKGQVVASSQTYNIGRRACAVTWSAELGAQRAAIDTVCSDVPQQTQAGLALLDPRLFPNRLIASDLDKVGYFTGSQSALEWKDSDSALVGTSMSHPFFL